MKSAIPTAALRRFQDADEAWMKEIRKLPGRPGDVRYTKAARGEPGTALRAAHDEFVAANDRAKQVESAYRFGNEDCYGGAFDGFHVTSDADPGL